MAQTFKYKLPTRLWNQALRFSQVANQYLERRYLNKLRFWFNDVFTKKVSELLNISVWIHKWPTLETEQILQISNNMLKFSRGFLKRINLSHFFFQTTVCRIKFLGPMYKCPSDTEPPEPWPEQAAAKDTMHIKMKTPSTSSAKQASLSAAAQHFWKKVVKSPITVFSCSSVALGLCFNSSTRALHLNEMKTKQGNGYSHREKWRC